MIIYHPVPDDTTSFSAVQIVPYLVAGLSEDQISQIVIPGAPLRSCLLGTIVTRPCVPIISPFVLDARQDLRPQSQLHQMAAGSSLR